MNWQWFKSPHAWALLLPIIAVVVNGLFVRKRWPAALDFIRLITAMFAMYPAIECILNAANKGFNTADNAQMLGGLFMLWIPGEAALRVLKQLYARVVPTAPELATATPPELAPPANEG